jgi:hypothetical protein
MDQWKCIVEMHNGNYEMETITCGNAQWKLHSVNCKVQMRSANCKVEMHSGN